MAQYSELVREAKQQFQREVSSLTPEIQANWKGLGKQNQNLTSRRSWSHSDQLPPSLCLAAGKLSTDDLNALIAHAHRRIDQLNRELAEQRVREKVHIQAALEQQKLEDQRSLENAVSSALQHVKEEARLEQERKVPMETQGRLLLSAAASPHPFCLPPVLAARRVEGSDRGRDEDAAPPSGRRPHRPCPRRPQSPGAGAQSGS